MTALTPLFSKVVIVPWQFERVTKLRHILYRLQYRKIKWGLLNKVGSKKIFSLKSMTKLEDLTVPIYSTLFLPSTVKNIVYNVATRVK
jgi:hypothetical protein